MTETDTTRRPLRMPDKFIPYLEKHRIYKLFKDMLQDLILTLPKDHLKHMKVYLNKRQQSRQETTNVILLVSPELNIDCGKLVRDLIKDFGLAVITRRYVIDQYEMHDNFVPGVLSPSLLSEVTKAMTVKDPIPISGWLMFDNPCTIREARCLQQDGVLPTVTVVLMPPPPLAPPAEETHTSGRSLFDQDFEGLKFAYKATLKEVHVYPDDSEDKVSNKLFNAIRACMAGAQGPGQGHHVVGAPGLYRVLIIGPRGSGRLTQAKLTAKHFGLVHLHFNDIYAEAQLKMDDIGEMLRSHGISAQLKAKIVKRRILLQDCLDHGWVMTGYPTTCQDFEILEAMPTPPNRVIFLNVDWSTCKSRVTTRAIDWCTGRRASTPNAPRALTDPRDADENLDAELDTYYSETLAELRASAGLTAVEIDGVNTIEHVQTKIQSAIICAPAFDIASCSRIRNARGD